MPTRSPRSSSRPWAWAAKRGIDLLGAGLGLILLAPVFLIIALTIRCALGRPVLFSQRRPGLNGEPFVLYKFRTMHETVDAEGNPLPDDHRLSRIGAVLRSTSLDELPELFNVLTGDMSLVGPRPLLMEYLDRYSPEQSRRHEAKPGLTGWAQINGRNALTWEEKFRLDVWYVENWGLTLDLKILWRTVTNVLNREGITAEGHATMPEFNGSGTKKENLSGQ